MKKLLLATAMLATVTATPVMANEALEKCTVISDIAGETMKVRQAGVPLSKAMSLSDNELIQTMTMNAYSKTRYATEKYQNEKITDFSDQWFMACMETYK